MLAMKPTSVCQLTHNNIVVLESFRKRRKNSILMLLLNNPGRRGEYSVCDLALPGFLGITQGKENTQKFRPLLICSH